MKGQPLRIEETCPDCEGTGGFIVGESGWVGCRTCHARGVVSLMNPGPDEAWADVPAEAYDH